MMDKTWEWPRGPPGYENGSLLPVDFMVYLIYKEGGSQDERYDHA